MALPNATWPLLEAIPGPPAGPLPEPSVLPLLDPSAGVTGYGLLRPLRRDEKNDFAADTGVRQAQSKVANVLGTRASAGTFPGELYWNPDFGSKLWILRHKPLTVATGELARLYVTEALRTWVPSVAVRAVEAYKMKSAVAPLRQEDALLIVVKYDIVTRQGNILVSGLNNRVVV